MTSRAEIFNPARRSEIFLELARPECYLKLTGSRWWLYEGPREGDGFRDCDGRSVNGLLRSGLLKRGRGGRWTLKGGAQIDRVQRQARKARLAERGVDAVSPGVSSSRLAPLPENRVDRQAAARQDSTGGQDFASRLLALLPAGWEGNATATVNWIAAAMVNGAEALSPEDRQRFEAARECWGERTRPLRDAVDRSEGIEPEPGVCGTAARAAFDAHNARLDKETRPEPASRFGERLRSSLPYLVTNGHLDGRRGATLLRSVADAIDTDAEELRQMWNGAQAFIAVQAKSKDALRGEVEREERLHCAREKADLRARVEAAVESKRYTATRDDGVGGRVALGREWDILDVKDVLAAIAEIFGSAGTEPGAENEALRYEARLRACVDRGIELHDIARHAQMVAAVERLRFCIGMPEDGEPDQLQAEPLLAAISEIFGAAGTERSKRDFDVVLSDYLEWSLRTFPTSTPASVATHLRKEVAELQARPESAEELADIVALAFHSAARQGHDLTAALDAKLAILKTRTWREPDADGVVEHVREPKTKPCTCHDTSAGPGHPCRSPTGEGLGTLWHCVETGVRGKGAAKP